VALAVKARGKDTAAASDVLDYWDRWLNLVNNLIIMMVNNRLLRTI
jgi:hypothetical protein